MCCILELYNALLLRSGQKWLDQESGTVELPAIPWREIAFGLPISSDGYIEIHGLDSRKKSAERRYLLEKAGNAATFWTFEVACRDIKGHHPPRMHGTFIGAAALPYVCCLAPSAYLATPKLPTLL